jgi:hypothetical protein
MIRKYEELVDFFEFVFKTNFLINLLFDERPPDLPAGDSGLTTFNGIVPFLRQRIDMGERIHLHNLLDISRGKLQPNASIKPME